MFTTIATTTTHTGPLVRVESLRLADSEGKTFEREVVRHPGAVLIVAPVTDEELLFVRNFRVAVDHWLLELPAGKLEPGEAPKDAAARELEEETGYRPAKITPIGRFYTSPGFCDELMHVFAASELTHIGQCLDEGEHLTVESVSIDDARAMIVNGEINDGKTIAAFWLWLAHMGRTA
jgi:ADP-ribose pyrophosphatase